jgi:hypothetical protein
MNPQPSGALPKPAMDTPVTYQLGCIELATSPRTGAHEQSSVRPCPAPPCRVGGWHRFGLLCASTGDRGGGVAGPRRRHSAAVGGDVEPGRPVRRLHGHAAVGLPRRRIRHGGPSRPASGTSRAGRRPSGAQPLAGSRGRGGHGPSRGVGGRLHRGRVPQDSPRLQHGLRRRPGSADRRDCCRAGHAAGAGRREARTTGGYAPALCHRHGSSRTGWSPCGNREPALDVTCGGSQDDRRPPLRLPGRGPR